MAASSSKHLAFVAPDLTNLKKTVRLGDDEFQELAQILGELTGIHMNAHKAPMVESRLYKRLRLLSLDSFADYVKLLKQDAQERDEFINALTTNKTEFFREPYHFDFLVNPIIRDLVQRSGSGTLNVWCAAASTGEEPYTLAMVLSEAFKVHPRWDFRILATDIDTDVLKKAESGVYKKELVEAVRPDLLQQYFRRGTGPNQGYYKINAELARKIKFRRFNLIADQLMTDITFDVIFLRNVLIYFQPDTIKIVIDKLSKRLRPGGYLIIGHSETLNRIAHDLDPLHSAIYRKTQRRL